jgi:hypothetical protein
MFFCVAPSNTVSGASRPSPLHMGRFGRVGQSEKQGRYPPGGDRIPNGWFPPLFFSAPPLPRLPPLRRHSICRSSRRKISSESSTVVSVGSLAGLFAATASLTRPRTRRQIRPTSAHRRCSTSCQVGAIGRCSLPPLPWLNFNNLFCFIHG